MQKYILNLSFLIPLILSLNSCSSTNMLEGDEKLLVSNKFKYEDKKIYGPITLNRYVKQKPNSKFLIFPVGLWVYDMTNKDLIDVFEAYDDLPKDKKNQHSLDSLYIAYGEPKYVGKKEWLNRQEYKLGQPPVIVNEKYTKQTATTLQNFFIKKGYRQAEVQYQILPAKALFNADKKDRIIYNIDAQQPTYISSYTLDIEDPAMREIILEYNKKAKVKQGDILDEYALKNELNYYTSAIRDNGYYKFNSDVENIYYESDSTGDKHNWPLSLVVTTGDSVNRIFRPNKIGKIIVTLTPPQMLKQDNNNEANGDPKADINCGKRDSLHNEVLCNRYYNKRGINFLKDTLNKVIEEKGDKYFSDNKSDILDNIYLYLDSVGDKKKYTYFKDKVITYPLVISPESEYRESEITNSKRNYFLLDNFNLIKGIDGYDATDSTKTYVNYVFELTPKKRQRLQILAEANYSDFLKIGTTLGVQYFRRNLLRGGENLNVSLSATLGTVSNDGADSQSGFFNASDISLQSSLKFPRWIIFNSFGMGKLRESAPTSSILAGISRQNNIGLGRINYNTQLNYFIQPTDLVTHSFSLVNIQYTNHQNPNNYYEVRDKDRLTASQFINYYKTYNPEAQEWLNNQVYNNFTLIDYIFDEDNDFVDYMQTVDPSLRSRMRYVYRNKEINTQNILINSIIYNVAYNQNRDPLDINPWNLNLKFELAGTVTRLIEKSFSKDNSHTILGVPYSQFFKVETDVRKLQTIRNNLRFAGRFFFGVGIPFGVSQNLPYDRNYIAGGSNDIRAWKPFALGPGDSKDEYSLGGLDNLKLLMSLELRFPLNESLEGALFTDMGNVWGTNKNYDYEFKFSEFYKQMGIGSGIGIRYNLGFFVVRADWAFKIYDPKYNAGERWNFKRLGFNKEGLSQSRLNFAIGYPF